MRTNFSISPVCSDQGEKKFVNLVLPESTILIQNNLFESVSTLKQPLEKNCSRLIILQEYTPDRFSENFSCNESNDYSNSLDILIPDHDSSMKILNTRSSKIKSISLAAFQILS